MTTFINKGTNGRSRETLTQAEIEIYEAKAVAELGSECSHWLGQGVGGVAGVCMGGGERGV